MNDNFATLDRLAELATQHPGGYPELILQLQTVDKTIHYTETLRGKVKDCTVTTAEIAEGILHVAAGQIQANNVTGFIANAIHTKLRQFQLPTPGHPDWTKPVALWERIS